jgi:muconolactone delta-isomerase
MRPGKFHLRTLRGTERKICRLLGRPSHTIYSMLFISMLRLRTESASRETLTPELVKQEMQRMHELIAAGIIRHAWKRNDGLSIIVVIEAASEAASRAIVASLPFNKANFLDIELSVGVMPYLEVYPEMV